MCGLKLTTLFHPAVSHPLPFPFSLWYNYGIPFFRSITEVSSYLLPVPGSLGENISPEAMSNLSEKGSELVCTFPMTGNNSWCFELHVAKLLPVFFLIDSFFLQTLSFLMSLSVVRITFRLSPLTSFNTMSLYLVQVS